MNTNENEIGTLLEKYYEGTSSLAEERILEEYFSGHQVSRPEHYWFEDRKNFRNESASEELADKINKKIESADSILHYRTWIMRIAAAVGFCMVVFIVYTKLTHTQSNTIVAETTTTQKDINLPDGTTIILNTNTRLRYPETFSTLLREVWLEVGEAYFEVAKNPAHPFIVHARQTRTEVIGTSFNISSPSISKSTEILVVSGTVSFGSEQFQGKEKILLNAGNGGVFDGDTESIEKINQIDPNRLAWKTRRLEFNDLPLEQVFKILEDYFKVAITVTDTEILTCRFRGTFNNAALKEIFEVMTFTLNIQVVKEGDVYSISGKGCKGN